MKTGATLIYFWEVIGGRNPSDFHYDFHGHTLDKLDIGGELFGLAAFAGTVAGRLRRFVGVEELNVLAQGRSRRASGAAEDAGRAHADDERAFGAAVSAGERPPAGVFGLGR